jgi:hypothetical protein
LLIEENQIREKAEGVGVMFFSIVFGICIDEKEDARRERVETTREEHGFQNRYRYVFSGRKTRPLNREPDRLTEKWIF